MAVNYLLLAAKKLASSKKKTEKPPNENSTVSNSPSPPSKTDTTTKSTEESKRWIDKSVFDDGYQFGDITKAILGGGDDDASFADLTLHSLTKGYNTARFGEETYKSLGGSANEKEVYEKLLADDKYRFVPGTKIASGISGAFELLGQTARQFANPRTLAVAGSAAGVAAAAGQAGPQIALPEEAVTVPAAFFGGLAAGSAASSFEIEGGLAYNEMVNAGVSKDTAAKIALAVGGVNAGLDLLQVDELLDAYKITKATGGTKTVVKKIFDELLDRGVDVAKQTTQELAQEGVTIAGVQVGSKIDTGKAAYTAEEV